MRVKKLKENDLLLEIVSSHRGNWVDVNEICLVPAVRDLYMNRARVITLLNRMRESGKYPALQRSKKKNSTPMSFGGGHDQFVIRYRIYDEQTSCKKLQEAETEVS